ncbi:MAG: thioredoxin family protein [Bacteroidales bacterium]|nr:thioredoxin family protein [Bacteroidales bacterium]
MKSFFKFLMLPCLMLITAVATYAQSAETVTLTEQTFLTKCYNYNNDKVMCHKPFIIEFGAEWCTWCKKQKPVMQNVQRAYGTKIQTFYVDVDKCPQAASIFDEIQEGIPCLIFVDPEKDEYEAINGYMDEGELKQALKEIFGL